MNRRFHLPLHLAAAALLGGAALAAGKVPDIALHWWHWQKPLFAAAGVLTCLSVLRPETAVARLTQRLCVVVCVLVGGVLGLEVFFRAVQFDFRFQAAAQRRLPPFYRQPTVPCGTVFFRREGPLEWSGQPVRTALQALGLDATAYAGEPFIHVRYDALGFRNHPRPATWELAVAGDSFTELGHLADEDLFTTRLARALGWRVLNLGVSHTGPLTHLFYLSHFGLSPSTRAVMIVFYEGNDLADLAAETAEERRWLVTGRRPRREPVPQSSLLRAWGERWRSRNPPTHLLSSAQPVDAFLHTKRGRIPVTLGAPPPDWRTLGESTATALGDFLCRLAELARVHGVQPWLVFMPAKYRVWHGQLEFTPEAAPVWTAWTPSDLPVALAAWCAEQSIQFVDLTPDLVTETHRGGDPLFNTLFDTHLTARGAQVVAATLARALAPLAGTAAGASSAPQTP